MDESRPGAVASPLPSRPPAVAVASARSRSAATNRPSSRFNANTATGRRCRDLLKGYLRALGDPTDAPTMALAVAAAEGVVISELARTACLSAGGMTGINIELMIRAENTANRALRRIGLAKASPKPAGPNLQEFLAAREKKAGS
jgi:hypothetical protein